MPFSKRFRAAKQRLPTIVIGGGTNLIVSDRGYRGLVLRYRGDTLRAKGTVSPPGAGAELQRLVDFSIDRGLRGLGGRWPASRLDRRGHLRHCRRLWPFDLRTRGCVRFFDGRHVRAFSNAECQFASAKAFQTAQRVDRLHRRVGAGTSGSRRAPPHRRRIVKVRNEKFPVTMQCAGRIFKNLLLRDSTRRGGPGASRVQCAKAKSGRCSSIKWGPRARSAATSTCRLSRQPYL